MSYQISKHLLRKKVKESIRLNYPNKFHDLTNSKIDRGMIFADGMIATIAVLGEEPINPGELDELVLRETLAFILRELDEK